MAVAPVGVGEGGLVEGLDGLAVTLLEGDRYQRFDACRRPLVVPSKSEDEALVLHDLAVDAAKPVLAVLRRLDHCAIGAADTKIDRHVGAGEILGTHPALDVLRARIEREHNRRWRVEGADNEQLVVSASFFGGHDRLPL